MGAVTVRRRRWADLALKAVTLRWARCLMLPSPIDLAGGCASARRSKHFRFALPDPAAAAIREFDLKPSRPPIDHPELDSLSK